MQMRYNRYKPIHWGSFMFDQQGFWEDQVRLTETGLPIVYGIWPYTMYTNSVARAGHIISYHNALV